MASCARKLLQRMRAPQPSPLEESATTHE